MLNTNFNRSATLLTIDEGFIRKIHCDVIVGSMMYIMRKAWCMRCVSDAKAWGCDSVFYYALTTIRCLKTTKSSGSF